MLRFIDHNKMGQRHGWLDSFFHFSISEYYNPENISFGVLRVLNDDTFQPGTGFDTHPHRDIEIVSYVVDGELTHADSMGNKHALTRGQIQYMSAGTGVTHSEFNLGEIPTRIMQIWIFPDKKGYEPNYGDHRFLWEDRVDKWLPIVSGCDDSIAPVRIHQDTNIFVTEISKGKSLEFDVSEGRQAYLVLIEGKADINGLSLTACDAMEITEELITIAAVEPAHVLILEMKKHLS